LYSPFVGIDILHANSNQSRIKLAYGKTTVKM
jgi:hypothetical protein